MRAFLNFIESAGCYLGFAMVPVYLSAEIFVMQNAEVQNFLVAHGFEMIIIPMFISIAAGKLKGRFDTTSVPLRDSTLFGVLGSSGLLVGSFVYTVPQPTISGLFFGTILAFSLFAIALSAAFYLKAERSWQEQGLDEQSGP